MSYKFCSKFHTLSHQCKKFENRLRFDKVTDSLKVGTFLRHSIHLISSLAFCHLLILHCDEFPTILLKHPAVILHCP